MAPHEIFQRQTPVATPDARRASSIPVGRRSQAVSVRLKSAVRFDPELVAAIRGARRILVLGSSGAGKTHFSMRLAEILDLDVIHLDAQPWRPSSDPSLDAEWREIVSSLSRRESWIMDGTYERSLDVRIPHADAIILLEHTPDRCLARVIERQKNTNDQPRPDLPAGYVERFDENHRRYVSHYPEVTRPTVLASIERYGPDKPVATIHTPEEIEPFLTQLRRAGISRLAHSPFRGECSVGVAVQ